MGHQVESTGIRVPGLGFGSKVLIMELGLLDLGLGYMADDLGFRVGGVGLGV